MSSSSSGSGSAGSGGTGSGSSGASCELVSSTSSGYTCCGAIQLGSNSSTGAPGYYVEGADCTGGSSEGHICWDTLLADGLESSNQEVVLGADFATGQSTLEFWVEGGMNYEIGGSLVACDSIIKVQIAAAVTASNVRITWIDITLYFNNVNNDSQTIVVPDELTPGASTWGGSGSSNSQVVEISPDRSDYTHVYITANIRLESSSTTLPSADALTARILVFAAE